MRKVVPLVVTGILALLGIGVMVVVIYSRSSAREFVNGSEATDQPCAREENRPLGADTVHNEPGLDAAFDATSLLPAYLLISGIPEVEMTEDANVIVVSSGKRVIRQLVADKGELHRRIPLGMLERVDSLQVVHGYGTVSEFEVAAESVAPLSTDSTTELLYAAVFPNTHIRVNVRAEFFKPGLEYVVDVRRVRSEPGLAAYWSVSDQRTIAKGPMNVTAYPGSFEISLFARSMWPKEPDGTPDEFRRYEIEPDRHSVTGIAGGIVEIQATASLKQEWWPVVFWPEPYEITSIWAGAARDEDGPKIIGKEAPHELDMRSSMWGELWPMKPSSTGGEFASGANHGGDCWWYDATRVYLSNSEKTCAVVYFADGSHAVLGETERQIVMTGGVIPREHTEPGQVVFHPPPDEASLPSEGRVSAMIRLKNPNSTWQWEVEIPVSHAGRAQISGIPVNGFAVLAGDPDWDIEPHDEWTVYPEFQETFGKRIPDVGKIFPGKELIIELTKVSDG